MMRLDEAIVFDRNKVVDEDRVFHPIAALGFGDVLDVVGHAPAGAERDDGVAALDLALEMRPFDAHADEIAHGGL